MKELDVLKDECIGKANIFDRYAYFCMELARYSLSLGVRINYDDRERITREGIVTLANKVIELEKKIAMLPKDDREFLIKDSKFYGSNKYGMNDDITNKI